MLSTEDMRVYMREYRAWHRELGLCLECNAPVAPELRYCLRHAQQHRAQRMAYYRRTGR